MSLDKGIEHGKEHRKQYTGAKYVDKRCRNHGDCDWCKGNRMHQKKKLDEAAEQALKEEEEDMADNRIRDHTEELTHEE